MCGTFFFFLKEKKPLNPRLKISHFIVSFPPPSKSYERVFINDWGAASLNKCKVKCSIYFFNKEAFFWNVPFRCCLIEVSSGERVSLWLVQIFLFWGHEEDGQGIKSYLFSYCSFQIYCIQYSKPIIITGFGIPMGTMSWPKAYPKNSLRLNETVVERSGRWILNKEFLSFLFKQETHNGPAPWAIWCFHENICVL